MKNLLTLFLIAATFSLNAQHCYTLYQDELKSHTGINSITALTEAPTGELIIGGESSLGGGMGLLFFDGAAVTKYKAWRTYHRRMDAYLFCSCSLSKG